jgi:hypothetical protein
LKKWRDSLAKANSIGVKGDFKGDGFHNCGAMVVDKGGKVLF